MGGERARHRQASNRVNVKVCSKQLEDLKTVTSFEVFQRQVIAPDKARDYLSGQFKIGTGMEFPSSLFESKQ